MVSVCVTTYNHENYIEQCLNSILNQDTDFQFEILLGEDNSTDETRTICERYAYNYPDKIRLFLRSRKDVIYIDGNPTGRFNFIENLKAARGKYIALCEGDDYWTDPHKLQKQIDFLETNEDYVLSCHNCSVVDLDGNFIETFNKVQIPITTDVTYLLQNSWYIPTASAVFRNYVDIPNWFCTVLNGDYALYLLLTSKGGLVNYESEIRSAYRLHSQGLSNVFKNRYVYNYSMIYINQKFNKYSKYRYKDICYSQIEKNALIILKNTKLSSKTFWVLIWNLVGPNRGMTKKIKDYLFNRIKASKLMKLFRL